VTGLHDPAVAAGSQFSEIGSGEVRRTRAFARARLLLPIHSQMRPTRNGDVLSSHLRAPAALVALMVIVAAALAWLSAGCSSMTNGPGDASAPQVDTAAPADGPLICAFDATYTYGPDGGLVASNVLSTLTPPASYRHTTTFLAIADPPPPLSCMPALPACGDSARVDASDIARDFADPDVARAMAMSTPPLYGLDSRPTDGTMFQLMRGDGHGFLAGPTCDTVSEFCHGSVPAGIARLVADLKALDQQQLADPSCASQNPRP
jgi:hypothetical protein